MREQAEEDRRRGRLRRHDHRSDHRAEDRPGNLLPSLQLAVEDPGANSSNCGEGYSCAYTNTISWATPTEPLPMELNPQVVFERMFGDGSTAEQRAARRKRDRSILDSLTGSLSRLQQRSRAPPIARASTSTRRTCARSSGGCRSR